MKFLVCVFAICISATLSAEITCLFNIKGNRCGRRTIKGDIYCRQHKEALDEKIKQKVKQEVADEYRAAEAWREAQTQIMAEGMARALGRTICLAARCKNYAPEGQDYCINCQKWDSIKIMAAKIKANKDRQYNEAMASLQQCKALNPDGAQCQRKANPGLQYCYRHVGYDNGVVISQPQKPIDPTEVTRVNMDNLEKSILRSLLSHS